MSSLSIAKAARASQRTRSLGQQQEARARYVNRMSKTNPHREPHSSTSKGSAAVDLRVQLDEARVAAGASENDAAAVGESPLESEDARPLPRTVEVSFADLAVGPKRSKQLSEDFEIVPRSSAVIAMDERNFSVGAGRSASASASALSSSSSEDEDDWELLEMPQGLDSHEYDSKKSGTRTWASIVRSKA